MSDSDTISQPRWRPRFSLLTALLFMTLVALLLVIWRQWWEVAPLRSEVRRLRNEVGELSIEDNEKVHAIEVATGEPLSWKWRVWMPDAGGAFVHLKFGDIPREGFPGTYYTLNLEGAGEHVITMIVRRDPVTDQWTCRYSTGGMSLSPAIPESEQWFTGKVKSRGRSEGVGFSTIAAERKEKTLLLKRHRLSPVDDSPTARLPQNVQNVQNPPGPLPGFIIWLERR